MRYYRCSNQTLGITLARPPAILASRPHVGVKIDEDVISKLIIKFNGNLSRAAQSLGCSRGAIVNRVHNNPDLKQLLADQRERWIDDLEQSCFERAVDGDTTLSMFLLKTQARHRGYDLDMSNHQAKDIATAAFEFILNKSKTPVNTKPQQPEQPRQHYIGL